MSTIKIIGASVRAAAASAMRAGFTPWCVDLFADVDLARACPARAVPLDRYPERLVAALAGGPPGPWMYTGGLENYPEILERAPGECWGNSPTTLRAVRDPRRLVEFGGPRLADRAPTAGEWMVKPHRGSGGLGVRRWNGEPIDNARLQEFVPGTPASAVFAGIDGNAALLGLTRQLISPSWSHAPEPFQYAGSIGPLLVTEAVRSDVVRLGERLTTTFGLRGLFGVDLVIDGNCVRPIEVNPRYPASLEILERGSGEALLAWHAKAFGRDSPRGVSPSETPSATRVWGKGILYAKDDLIVSDGPWLAPSPSGTPGGEDWGEGGRVASRDRKAIAGSPSPLTPPSPPGVPGGEGVASFLSFDSRFADVPAAGSHIPRGSPVVTFFASAESDTACEATLGKIAGDLDRALFGR